MLLRRPRVLVAHQSIISTSLQCVSGDLRKLLHKRTFTPIIQIDIIRLEHPFRRNDHDLRYRPFHQLLPRKGKRRR
jgi:hypothetical protein